MLATLARGLNVPMETLAEGEVGEKEQPKIKPAKPRSRPRKDK
jgi:hypothetical protein